MNMARRKDGRARQDSAPLGSHSFTQAFRFGKIRNAWVPAVAGRASFASGSPMADAPFSRIGQFNCLTECGKEIPIPLIRDDSSRKNFLTGLPAAALRRRESMGIEPIRSLVQTPH